MFTFQTKDMAFGKEQVCVKNHSRVFSSAESA